MDYKNIKFRAWHKEQQKMFEVLVLDMNSGEVFLGGFTVSTIYKGETQEEPMWVFVDEVELMMYTGQQDKHGENIFEGDIVKYFDDSIIYWNDEYCCFSGQDYEGYDNGGCLIASKHTKHREIIGNKYENPELLQP